MRERPDIRNRAWSKCEVGAWNLSWDSITSATALTAFVRESEEVRRKVEGQKRIQAPEKRKLQKKPAAKHQEPRSRAKSNRKREPEPDVEIEEPFDNDIEDDLSTPLEIIETAVNLPRIPPPDTGFEGLTISTIQTVTQLRQKRSLQLQDVLQDLPEGYHYSLRNRGHTSISYHEDTTDSSDIEEAGYGSGSELEGEAFDIDSDSEAEDGLGGEECSVSTGDVMEDDEIRLCQQLGGLGVYSKPYALPVRLQKAARTGGVQGRLIFGRLGVWKRGIVKRYTWRKPASTRC